MKLLNPYRIKATGVTALMAGVILLLSGCFKDFKEDYLFTDFMVEFDAATWQSRAPGKTFPVLGPLEKGSGVQNYQINLLGEQRPVAQEIQYRVDPDLTDLVEGVHYRLADQGRVIMPANESIAYVSIEILDFPAESGLDTLVLELIPSDGVKVSQNYRQLGIAVLLTGPPSGSHPLYDQLGSEHYYNSIYVDPLNRDLPADVAARIEQSARNLASVGDGSRILQNLYFYFNQDHVVNVVAHYNGGGGNSLTGNAYAIWNYKFVPNAQGEGQFVFIDANANGDSQKGNFAPILNDYLEKYTFKVDWVTSGSSIQAIHKEQWGGLYRVDDPDSYLMGSLEALSPTGAIRPFPQAQAVHDMFTDGTGGYFTGLYIDPLDPAQSASFRQRWEDGAAYVVGLAGRQLHKMAFHFNPANNFQDVRVVTYYYSSTGGRFIGQVRSQLKVATDGIVQPFSFTFQDGNGGATRSPEIFDNFLLSEEFSMSRSGNRVRFTSVSNPSEYFEGVLGNYSLTISEFWPE